MLRALVGSIILAVLWASFARAEVPKTTLGISPAITEWLVAPGETSQKKVFVTNTTKEPLPISSLVRPFRLQETDYADLAASSRYDASGWLKVKDGDFILRPGKTRKVAVTLAVPKNALPGGHYATVYFRQLRPVGTGGAEAQVGLLAFITVKGKLVKKLEGEQLAARWSGGALTIAAKLRNEGNVHVMPKGQFVVYDWQGKEVDRVTLPQGMTMPQTVRTYQVTPFKKLGYGVYTVKPELSYGDNRHIDLPAATAWAVPWKETALIVAVVAGGWFGGYKIRDRWRRAFFALTRRSG